MTDTADKASGYVFSCEHATPEIPDRYRQYANPPEAVRLSHQGWDPGAKELMEVFLRGRSIPSVQGRLGRLILDLNRSENNPKLWSEWSDNLSDSEKEQLKQDIYWPYRNELEGLIRSGFEHFQTVIHLSFHSFTPLFFGQVREVELGLLYDPNHKLESAFCEAWAVRLKEALPGMDIRTNEPYAGTDDGLTSIYRKRFGSNYAGLEIELSQGITQGDGSRFQEVCKILCRTFFKTKPVTDYV